MSSSRENCAEQQGQKSSTTGVRESTSNSNVGGNNNPAVDDDEESSSASSSSSSSHRALAPSGTGRRRRRRHHHPSTRRDDSSLSASSLSSLTSWTSSYDADMAYARATVERIIRTGQPVSVDLGSTDDEEVGSDDSEITLGESEETPSSSSSASLADRTSSPSSSSAAAAPLVSSSASTAPTIGTTSTSSSSTASNTSRPSGLYWRVFPGCYNRAIRRCRTHPSEARFCLPLPSASQPEVYGLSPIHHVCHRSDHPPPALARALLDAWPESSELTDYYGYTPLHRAVGSEGMGMDAFRVVLRGGMERDLRRNPGFVVDGQNFLQRLCNLYAVDMAEALRGISWQPCNCRRGGDGCGGCINGGVPLRGIAGREAASPEPPPPRELAIVAGGTQGRNHHQDQQGRDHGHSLFLDKVALLVSAYCHRSIPRTDDSSASQYLPPSIDGRSRRRRPPRKFRMVHACLETPDCPPPLLELALRLHPNQIHERDEDGNYPLHVAAANTSLNRGPAIASFSGRLFEFLLSRFPSAASSCNHGGRLPLNLAIEALQGWDVCLSPLLAAAPDALETRDPARNLYPFMIAATVSTTTSQHDDGDLDRLDVVYRLLRACPEIDRLSGGRRRRRRDGSTGGGDQHVSGGKEEPPVTGKRRTVISVSPPWSAPPSPRRLVSQATTDAGRSSRKRKRKEAQHGVCTDEGGTVAPSRRRRDQEGGGRDDDAPSSPT